MRKEALKASETAVDSPERRFAEELLRFCERAYEVERDRKEEMEKKAQFYLALITGILGILAIKGGEVDLTVKPLGLLGGGVVVVMVLLLFLASILIALFCMIKVLAPRGYEKPYPSRLLTTLFSPSARFKTDADLLRAQAEELAGAAEINFRLNVEKSGWLSRLSNSVLVVIVALFLLLTVANI